jgi:hypothetical protein
VNEFWFVLKGLQGRTVQEVKDVHVGDTDEELHSRVQITCTDGYTVQLYVDYEDLDLAVQEGTHAQTHTS